MSAKLDRLEFPLLESDIAELVVRYRKARADRKALLEACKWFMAQLENQTLVRTLNHDDKPDYFQRMLALTQGLRKAYDAIAAAKASE